VPALDLRPAVLACEEADVVPSLSLRERDVGHDSHNVWVESERVEDVMHPYYGQLWNSWKGIGFCREHIYAPSGSEYWYWLHSLVRDHEYLIN